MITVNITEQVQQVSVEVLEADVAALKSQLDTHVETVNKPALDTYTTTKEGELDTYTTTKEGELETYKDEKLQEISDHGTELTGFSGSVVIDGDTYEFENGILKQQL